MKNHARDLWISCGAMLAILLASGAASAQQPPLECNSVLDPTVKGRDLLVTGECLVEPGKDYHYANINIIKGGALLFREYTKRSHDGLGGVPYVKDTKTNLWASSIVIENEGKMDAHAGPNDEQGGRFYSRLEPYGAYGGTLTIHLYGENKAVWDKTNEVFTQQNLGAVCKSEDKFPAMGPCGIPKTRWDDNGKTEWPDLPGGVRDFFYQYGPLYGDGRCTDGSVFNFATGKCASAAAKVGYFGNKVLAVSYGGTLTLAGAKGACHDIDIEAGRYPCYGLGRDDPLRSAPAWTRLKRDLPKDGSQLVIDYPLTARPGDEIVVTTTDYLPGHSEVFLLDKVDGTDLHITSKAQWAHSGTRYGSAASQKPWSTRLPEDTRKHLDPDLVQNGAETRAAVALLTRSIRIVSADNTDGKDFPPEPTDNTKGYFYGAHMVIRQGFEKVQIQGVEFKQMGQGGRLAHYPVHFHMARKTPNDTHVKDSSINESMTRWIVVHSTLGVTLARNVGYKSIGHGFYLEDGTETDNKFHSNIGIFARAAIDNAQNKRKVPGILAENKGLTNGGKLGFLTRSDIEYPTVFWITNGWNDFAGNMAAGAGTCGAAFWLVPAANADMAGMTAPSGSMTTMKWSGYAALQGRPGFGGTTPLKSFSNNYATSTMHSFQTTADAPACLGVIAADEPPPNRNLPYLKANPSDAPRGSSTKLHYYPNIQGARIVTHCPWTNAGYDCSKVVKCGDGPTDLPSCGVTVLDRYTSSFHWADGNVSAIWLRPHWYLLTDSVISDVQNGGLTFVSGGDYTRSSAITGYWTLARNTIFIGNTIADTKNPWTRNTGPFSRPDGLKCEMKDKIQTPNYCLSTAEGIVMPTNGFFTNQRLSNIYDGPSYQDRSIYLDIHTAECPVWKDNDTQGSCMYGSPLAYLRLKTTPLKSDSSCYLPNAAIGWKQPNGFYYPPAFHSSNLFFDGVDIRHYVIDPIFKKNTYLTDTDKLKEQYCTVEPTIFNTWTSIDQQTVLNDVDGSLTGLTSKNVDPDFKQTISVNEDAFFSAPVETSECASSKATDAGDNTAATAACSLPKTNVPPATARTSPYDYVTTAVHAVSWEPTCSYPNCYGVPLYRQYLTGNSDIHNPSWEWRAWYAKPGECDKTPQNCKWPFIRMAGLNISQRQTMTVNNGSYYLDTTVSEKTQLNEPFTTDPRPRALNVFAKNQTYTMFFVYAKQSTVQTYKMYVGKKFDKVNGFKPGRVDVSSADVITQKIQFFVPTTADKKWVTWNLADDGMLTVNVDFRGLATELEPSPDNGLCQPAAFCKRSGNACASALDANNPLYKASEAVCTGWAMKDLDCPVVKKQGTTRTGGGCFGFSFTLGDDFLANDQYLRPYPGSFPTSNSDNKQGKPDWATEFKKVDGTSGRCAYPEAPKRDCRH
jgi:cell migration-inducing and hyaluronan-binding protein